MFGRYDFLLISKNKEDIRPWTEIPPRIMYDLPDFKMGKLSKEDKEKEDELTKGRNERILERNEEIKEAEKKKMEKRDQEERNLLNSIVNINMEDDDEDISEDQKNKKMKTSL